MSNTILETERLILRPFEDSDLEAVLEFNSHPEVVKYTGEGPLKNLEDAQHIMKMWHEEYEVKGYGRYAVVHKGDNKVIGFSGLKWESDLDETDIGYRFLPQYWGKGIATESCIPFMQHGFKTLGLPRIVGLVLPENTASSNVLLKIGMEHYKTELFPGEDLLCKWYKKENDLATPIVVSADIKSDKSKVWAALTDPKEMKKWYFEQITDFEPRVGFATEFVIHNEDKTFTHQWSVIDVKANDSIMYKWQYPEYSGRSTTTFKLQESPEGIKVTVTCDGLETFPNDVPEFRSESCRGGWEYFLNRLKQYCEK